jgi:hypothetical protein
MLKTNSPSTDPSPVPQGKCQTDVLCEWKNEMKGTFRVYRAENQKPVEISTPMSTKLVINVDFFFST